MTRCLKKGGVLSIAFEACKTQILGTLSSVNVSLFLVAGFVTRNLRLVEGISVGRAKISAGSRGAKFILPYQLNLIRWWGIHLTGGTPGGFFTTARSASGLLGLASRMTRGRMEVT